MIGERRCDICMCVCVYPCKMEYYSTIRTKEVLPSAAIWMEHEGIILSEVCQRKTTMLYDIIYKWNLKKPSA